MSSDELRELCAELEHPVDEERLAIGQMLLDVNGDGEFTQEEFSMWWRAGEVRKPEPAAPRPV